MYRKQVHHTVFIVILSHKAGTFQAAYLHYTVQQSISLRVPTIIGNSLPFLDGTLLMDMEKLQIPYDHGCPTINAPFSLITRDVKVDTSILNDKYHTK